MLEFDAFGRRFGLILEPNDSLLQGLSVEAREALKKDVEVFRGEVIGAADSWLRLSRSGDRWSGMIWDGSDLLIVEPVDRVARSLVRPPPDDEMSNVIYRFSDTEAQTPATCGNADIADSGSNVAPVIGENPLDLLGSDLAESEALRGMALSQEAIEIAVVADADFVGDNGSNTAFAVTGRMNVVDGIFDSQVGVALSVVEILELPTNGSLTSTNANLLLDQFADFVAGGSINNPGLTHLFTGRNLDGSTVGIAFVRSLCSNRFGVGVSEARGGGTQGALTIAHELGHNFGAPHDNQNGSACSGTPNGFLMNPFLNGSDSFSQCSLNQIAPIVARASCLVPVPEPKGAAMLLGGGLLLLLLRSVSVGCRPLRE